MGLFSHDAPLAPIFQGYVDCHCHILPGVDDGVQRMEDSLSILSRYYEAGVSQVWLTPHIMQDCPNTPERLRSRFEELQKAIAEAGIQTPELHLAAEHMMDELFDERIEKKEVMPHANRNLLVETSYYNPPLDLYGTLERVRSNGFFPMLAHPERYIYMGDKDYEKLKSLGTRFQLNLSSLCGLYGPEAKKKAEKFLKRGWYDYTGTDLHRSSVLDKYLSTKVSEKALDNVRPIIEQFFEEI